MATAKIRGREACDNAGVNADVKGKAREATQEEGFIAALRGLSFSSPSDPGVPLCFTPGFMLSPRFTGSGPVN